jgi:hypothetical protein
MQNKEKFFYVTAWSRRFVPLFVSGRFSSLLKAQLFAEELAAGRLDRMSHVSVHNEQGKIIVTIDCIAIAKTISSLDKSSKTDVSL